MVPSRTKVILFLIFLSVVILVIGQHFGGRLGLLLGFLLAVGINSTLFFFGQNQMLKKMHAKPLLGRDAWGLNDLVKKLAQDLHTPVPRLYLIESSSPTAFSFGLDQNQACLCVTTDLLARFSRPELEAILAHQLCQLSRNDSFSFAVFSILTYSLIAVSELADALLPTQLFTKRPHRFFQYLAYPLAWGLVKLAVGRKFFYETDAHAGVFLQDRRRLGEILWKLETLSHTRPLRIPAFSSHMFIVNPSGRLEKSKLGQFHPPMAQRLTALIGTPTA